MANRIETEERRQVAEIIAEIREDIALETEERETARNRAYWASENSDTRRGAELERQSARIIAANSAAGISPEMVAERRRRALASLRNS